jgi:hypothetical protein
MVKKSKAYFWRNRKPAHNTERITVAFRNVILKQSHIPILTFNPMDLSGYFCSLCRLTPFYSNKTEMSIPVAEFGTWEMATHGDLQSLYPAPCGSGNAPLGGKYKRYNYLTHRPTLSFKCSLNPTASQQAEDPGGRHASGISFNPIGGFTNVLKSTTISW